MRHQQPLTTQRSQAFRGEDLNPTDNLEVIHSGATGDPLGKCRPAHARLAQACGLRTFPQSDNALASLAGYDSPTTSSRSVRRWLRCTSFIPTLLNQLSHFYPGIHSAVLAVRIRRNPQSGQVFRDDTLSAYRASFDLLGKSDENAFGA